MSKGEYKFPDEELVLEGCDKLIDFHAWVPNKIDPRGWLGNFSGEDRRFALVLLNRFTFFADHLVDQLFRAAFHNISNRIHPSWESFPIAQDRWRSFCEGAIVTFVQGEVPNPSDSGPLFARKARQTLGVSEEQLLEPAAALEHVADGFTGPLIFVDDFVGSGQQFLNTWRRHHKIGGRTTSFECEVRGGCAASFFYCNAMTTEYGRDRIRKNASVVQLSTGNLIPRTHSLAVVSSALWPKEIASEGVDFVERIGRQLGYTADDGGEADWRGFHQLGLGVAFQHSTPDANLPIFFTEEQGWTPLVRRT